MREDFSLLDLGYIENLVNSRITELSEIIESNLYSNRIKNIANRELKKCNRVLFITHVKFIENMKIEREGK
ncbi:MAG: hypothetical protein HFJ29_01410 [Clostridia bacterium]|nr:hypothetical protein [Clostridia bacterium]